jgi:hypothetical protein
VNGADGCAPMSPPSPPNRPIPEIPPGGQIAGYNFTVQCGSAANPDDRKTLLLYEGDGYPRQNRAQLDNASDPTDYGYTEDKTKWNAGRHFQFGSHDEDNGCPGLLGSITNDRENDLLFQPVDSLKNIDGEYVLCPGIYQAGVWIRNTKVRLDNCATGGPCDVAGRCNGSERDHPAFIMAGQGFKVRTTSKGDPKPPYDTGEHSATYVKGFGVTLVQTKHQSGGYAKFSFDKNSDLRLTPPPMNSASIFKGISMYIDRDFKKTVYISGRALAGPLGGISGDIYGINANVVVRGGSKNVAELVTPIKASFVVGSLRFGGKLNEGGDDDEDDICDTEEDPDDIAACQLDAADEDGPSGVFAPEDGGAYASRIVLAPLE